MNPFRKLISALVALWLERNVQDERFEVDEHGVAVTVIIKRDIPGYVVSKVAETPVWSYSDN